MGNDKKRSLLQFGVCVCMSAFVHLNAFVCFCVCVFVCGGGGRGEGVIVCVWERVMAYGVTGDAVDE